MFSGKTLGGDGAITVSLGDSVCVREARGPQVCSH